MTAEIDQAELHDALAAARLPCNACSGAQPRCLRDTTTVAAAGAVVGAEAGTLTFMVGGNRSAADAAMPLLRSMGSAVIYVGA